MRVNAPAAGTAAMCRVMAKAAGAPGDTDAKAMVLPLTLPAPVEGLPVSVAFKCPGGVTVTLKGAAAPEAGSTLAMMTMAVDVKYLHPVTTIPSVGDDHV